jgi:hypothetical protein
MLMVIGSAHVQCPECHDVIPVPIDVEIETADDGAQNLKINPDMADLWAHAWGCLA